MNSSSYYDEVQAAVAALALGSRPKIGLVLGSGMSPVLACCNILKRVSYSDIPGLHAASAPSHRGEFVLAECAGQELLIANGRLHIYEGLPAQAAVKPVYIMRACGLETLITTNAAGALNEHFKVAQMMVIDDHINHTGLNPLIGFNDERLGVRFPDMSQAYSSQLSARWQVAAKACDITVQNGVYIGVTGPSLETSAERRFFKAAGADAVGMSTVLEVIAAKHCGLDVLGLSAITNMATGGPEQQVDSIEAVITSAQRVAENIAQILPEFLRGLARA